MSTKILALDTATENCSVALLVGDQLYVRSEVAPRDHTKKILPMVDEVLKEAGLTLHELDALAFGRGPGSFTGVRIGIGIAQGLAFGADLPMIGISTLAAMAQGSYRVHGMQQVACAIDARMSEVYWGRFSRQADGSWNEMEPECVIPPLMLAEQIQADERIWGTAGTGWDAYVQELAAIELQRTPSEVLYPDARDIAYLATFELAKGNTVDAEQASPVYLRDNVAWKKLPGRE
ncbi:tRNA (adenosine(37)-N6)-threonylcarbamoyltransferase complex dimerization subunit type 1 TsaB [Vibrio sp. V39_P1S14PM300]|uniref:tRNA (adenosine(37)-N6)-threonylcarbamoyltransferase complex dimerization subunit type 1 TsaB n=1 Tax=Vibrio sp. V39_P1S14PM300 TaxID=1938690 RepID=UPI001372CD8F|nr:tRNA (adenosine(37)-N6)-threonylcarbamoyltransferase complex dimerization subunit type 1 TsaB [Vibrio sp. V39_P1S14PM300]NAX19877.1 tRNA (adenosine(37)-N6)-threonylcarbamoyltransferase complex dimerization subunit type 1 TsaB [Vibrio sp. V39_P1S14PM300]